MVTGQGKTAPAGPAASECPEGVQRELELHLPQGKALELSGAPSHGRASASKCCMRKRDSLNRVFVKVAVTSRR